MIVNEALNTAGITRSFVAIITRLIALSASLKIRTDEAITASRQLAILAGIGQDLIAIVTAFAAFSDPVATVHELAIVGAVRTAIALLHAGLGHPIAAPRHGAVIQAAIGLDSVAIIASLAGVQEPIAASGWSAQRGAAIIFIFVAIIAPFVAWFGVEE